MNVIQKHPVLNLGYNFIEKKYLENGKDEYYFRNEQNPKSNTYRPVSQAEIDILIRNRNNSDNWNNIHVSKSFNPERVKNCNFFGLVRIGKLEPYYLEFHNLRMPVGLYNSTIISSDLGDNVCISNVSYLSHYIIGEDVMIANVSELATTGYAKFGNGIMKEGEDEKTRVRIELCNENGGRHVIPFDGMLPGDAWLWSKYRDDVPLMNRFLEFTENKFDKKRGHYGMIGDRTVIKNCKIIKDVLIGSDAYLKGANKLKNLTINSDMDRTSQIGEGCELVNGIIGYGCRIFYGVKAVRFVMSSHSQLKYGARLINSFLGNNSTISCCEVLNSLIFPAHEQHHNNSFLCAALVMGQSNIAAGATIGSNHNSRGADGEMIAGRGFWPGLCVSLKHNSKFATFALVSKGDYPAELNIPFPFCLISNDVSEDKLVVMPGYWFMYNMYALARNTWKYEDRDRRTERIQCIEYDFLAPDTVNEMFTTIQLLQELVPDTDGHYYIEGLENSKRPTEIVKVAEAILLFTELIQYYATLLLHNHFNKNKFTSFDEFKKSLTVKIARSEWVNMGGQLVSKEDLEKLKRNVKSNKIKNWAQLHEVYKELGNAYPKTKLIHGYSSILEILNITGKQFTQELFIDLLQNAVTTKDWMCKGIYKSRVKDYVNPFRQMVYDNQQEMNMVVGKIEDNSFIQKQLAELERFKKQVKITIKKINS